MGFVGGDVISIAYAQEPGVGTGTWYPKAGEDGTVDMGGVRNSDDAQGITSNGLPIWNKTNGRWFFETTIAWDSQGKAKNELEVAKKMAASPIDVTFTITLINGAVYTGKGNVVGDIKGSAKDATMSIKLSGGGELTENS